MSREQAAKEAAVGDCVLGPRGVTGTRLVVRLGR